ncbi:MAG: AsmA family protein [Terricaulis sp.]
MMKAWWHWVIAILGTIVAVALLAAGGLTYLILRLDVRGEIERAVENATGRQLTIRGDVGVSYWPVLGLRATNTALSNVAGGRAPAFSTSDEIDIGVELQPLFNRQIVVRNLVLQRPRIALEVDATGKPNWIFTPPTRQAAPAAPARPVPQQRPNRGVVDIARTTLREVKIVDGEVTYFDARHNSGWGITAVNATTAFNALNQPVLATGGLQYNGKPVTLEMSIADPGAMLHGRPTLLTVSVHSELLTATFSGESAIAGALNGQMLASGPNLRQFAAWIGTPIHGGVGLEQFQVNGLLATGDREFTFSNAGFAIDLVQGRGDFAISQRNGKPYLSGRLQLFDFDMNPYLLGHAPPKAEPINAPPPAPLPPESEPLHPQTAVPSAQIAAVAPPPRPVDVQGTPSATPIDFSGLHTINADLDLVTSTVLVQHTRFDAARLSVVINDGYLAATIQSLSLYGGSAHGRFEIDAREPDAKISEDMNFDGIDAQRFLSDAVNFTNIEGKAEISASLHTHGRSVSELLGHADGRTHIEVVTGVLHGVDLGGVSKTIRNALRGELIAPDARTPFLGFSGTFAIADGALASDDLRFNTTELRIPGIAVVDIPAKRLDLRVVPQSPRGNLFVIPFSARGPWSRLEYTSDVTGRALRAIQPRVRQVQAASRATN